MSLQPFLFLRSLARCSSPSAAHAGFPAGGAFNVFVPGLLIQLALFGAAFVGFGLIGELRNGVIERMRVSPISRLALLLGRSLRDIVVLLVQCVLLIVMAVPFGLRVNLAGTVVAFGLIALLGLLMASLSYSLALWLKSEDALAPFVNTFTLPLLLLSGILLPMSMAPSWLRTLSDINPLRYAVDAARALFNQHLSDSSIPQAVAILGVLAVVALVLASRSFSRAAA